MSKRLIMVLVFVVFVVLFVFAHTDASGAPQPGQSRQDFDVLVTSATLEGVALTADTPSRSEPCDKRPCPRQRLFIPAGQWGAVMGVFDFRAWHNIEPSKDMMLKAIWANGNFIALDSQSTNKPSPINREDVGRYLQNANAPAMVGAHPERYSICVLLYADTSTKPIERGYACRRKTDDEFELQFSDEPIGAWDVNVPQTKGALFVMKWISKTCRIAMWPNSNELVFGGKHAASHCDP